MLFGSLVRSFFFTVVKIVGKKVVRIIEVKYGLNRIDYIPTKFSVIIIISSLDMGVWHRVQSDVTKELVI